MLLWTHRNSATDEYTYCTVNKPLPVDIRNCFMTFRNCALSLKLRSRQQVAPQEDEPIKWTYPVILRVIFACNSMPLRQQQFEKILISGSIAHLQLVRCNLLTSILSSNNMNKMLQPPSMELMPKEMMPRYSPADWIIGCINCWNSTVTSATCSRRLFFISAMLRDVMRWRRR